MKLGFVRRDVGEVSKRNELSWLFFFISKNHLDGSYFPLSCIQHCWPLVKIFRCGILFHFYYWQ